MRACEREFIGQENYLTFKLNIFAVIGRSKKKFCIHRQVMRGKKRKFSHQNVYKTNTSTDAACERISGERIREKHPMTY